MDLASKFFRTEWRQSAWGLLGVLMLGIPIYLTVFPEGPGAFAHLLTGLLGGLILATLADRYLIWRWVRRCCPTGTGSTEVVRPENISRTPVVFHRRVLVAHTLLVAVLPGAVMLSRVTGSHVFDWREPFVFAAINGYLCATHALIKLFLAERLVQQLFLPVFADLPSPPDPGRYARAGLMRKLLSVFFLLGILPLLLIAGVSWYRLGVADRAQAGTWLASEARALATAGNPVLRGQDYSSLRHLAEVSGQHIMVLDREGKVLFSVGSPSAPDTHLLVEEARGASSGWSYREKNGTIYGYAWNPEGDLLVVRAIHSREGPQSMAQIQWVILALAATGMFNAAAAGYLASSYMSTSVRLLTEGMQRVHEGDLTVRVVHTGSDEFALLASGFNAMVAGLAQRESALRELTEQLEERVRARTRELEDAYLRLKEAQDTLEAELHLARAVQQRLLPDAPPSLPGYTIHSWAAPAREVGGDLYDFLLLEGDALGVAVGDVAGKSVPAALVMSLTQGLLHYGAARRSSPGQLLTHVNRLLTPVMPRGMFVTMTYLVLDPRGRSCRLASAGGLSPLLIRPATGDLAYLEVPGFPLGTLGDLTYQDREFPLEPGDILLLYSDGLVEAVNERGEFFGFGRLEEFARRTPPAADLFLAWLLEEIGAFTGGATQYDDITLVVIQRRDEEEKR